jgi:DNA polymerase-1
MLWFHLQKQLLKPYYSSASKDYTLKDVADVEFALLPVLHKMTVRGIKIDQERLEGLIKEIKAEYEIAMSVVGDMNTKSPLQTRAYLEKHGITNWPLTEKGAPSFPEEWLLTTEPGKAIVKVRKNRTLLDSFLIPLQTRHIVNGRVHTNFHQTRDTEYGTRTGRMSTTDPNLGAMPGKRQGELGKRFRSVFVPDEGMEFTEGDFATCEIRICNHYCHAKTWDDGFTTGVDPHTSVAKDVGIDRRHAKTINLAIMTGSGKAAIAKKLGLSMDEGSAIVDRYFRGLPELKSFQRKSADIFTSRGFISTLLGRRLQLADRSKGYTAVNRLTQGGNADLCKAAMVAMDKVTNVDMLLTVYDSALFQHEKGGDLAKLNALQAMVNLDKMGIKGFTVPMAVDYGTGDNWGEASFNEEGRVEWSPS